MRVLVTGNEGYIGAVLTPMLLAEGYDVRGYDSGLFDGCDFAPLAKVPVIRKDIRAACVDDFAGIDVVIHLAALSNDPLGNLNPQITYDINHLASVRLAELAKTAGVRRFIFSSSCSLYGKSGDDFLDETSGFNPVTPYGHSKVLSEQGIAPLADEDFTPVFLRNSTAYGVSPRLRFSLVLNDLVALGLTTGLVLIKSDGTPWRPLVHVQDISRAFLAALRAPAELVRNQAFNIGRTDQNLRVSELAEFACQAVPGSRVEYAPGGSPDTRCYRVSCEKAAKVLGPWGFTPQWDVKKGAVELYDAYRAAGVTTAIFEGPRYQRIARVRDMIKAGELDASLRFTSAQESSACACEAMK